MFLSTTLEPRVLAISNITEKNLNQRVKIIGTIEQIREYNNNTFQVLTLTQENSSIKAIASSRNSLVPLIEKSKTYEITGIIEKNNQTLQINIAQIKWQN